MATGSAPLSARASTPAKSQAASISATAPTLPERFDGSMAGPRSAYTIVTGILGTPQNS
jgi:hypothetical protein